MFDNLKWLIALYNPLRRLMRHPNTLTLSKSQQRYQAKKRIVRGIWIAAGIMMLSYPLLPFVVTVGLVTTFFSFTILDESA